jgi:hypothetical protein
MRAHGTGTLASIEGRQLASDQRSLPCRCRRVRCGSRTGAETGAGGRCCGDRCASHQRRRVGCTVGTLRTQPGAAIERLRGQAPARPPTPAFGSYQKWPQYVLGDSRDGWAIGFKARASGAHRGHLSDSETPLHRLPMLPPPSKAACLVFGRPLQQAPGRLQRSS